MQEKLEHVITRFIKPVMILVAVDVVYYFLQQKSWGFYWLFVVSLGFSLLCAINKKSIMEVNISPENKDDKFDQVIVINNRMRKFMSDRFVVLFFETTYLMLAMLSAMKISSYFILFLHLLIFPITVVLVYCLVAYVFGFSLFFLLLYINIQISNKEGKYLDFPWGDEHPFWFQVADFFSDDIIESNVACYGDDFVFVHKSKGNFNNLCDYAKAYNLTDRQERMIKLNAIDLGIVKKEFKISMITSRCRSIEHNFLCKKFAFNEIYKN